MSVGRKQPERVLVGIDGSIASRNAVRWAAQEARIRRTNLIITHIERHDAVPVGQDGHTLEPTALLELSAVLASHQEPGVVVGTMLLRGSISDELVKLSRSSAMLVLGLDQERTRASHGPLGPVEDRVVAHAECPVVTLNSTPRSVEHSQPFIVVGWTNTKTGNQALAAAAEEAEIRNATLDIVSVAPQLENVEPAEAQRRHRRALLKAQSWVQDSHPGVAADLVQSSGEVAQALIRHSLNADLLVVGCHHTGDPWSFHTGPVVEAVMRGAGCPVMLVGRLATRRQAGVGLPLERHTVPELTT